MTELTIDQALQQGVEAHKAGQVQEADRLYTAILKAQPKHPDANHNMGVLAVGVGKVQEALPFFKTALEANPATAQFWLSYIDALIKLEKLADAKAVLDQAKSKGAKGDGFDKLEQRLQDAGQEPLKGKQVASEPQLKQPNILDTLKLDQAIKLAKKKAKAGSTEEAKRIYQDILTRFPKNKRASDGLKGLAGRPVGKVSTVQDAPTAELQSLIALYNNGQLALVVEQAQNLTKQYPKAFAVWNLLGASAAQIGQLDQAIVAFKRVLAIKPDYAEAYNNMGLALQDQGKPDEAIVAYNKALSIKPDHAEAYNNMGATLKEQGKLEEAIEAYNKALSIKPDYAKAYNNMGLALQDQGKLDEAIAAYNKALSIKPDYAEAYCNKSYSHLLMGDFDEGWDLYEWRTQTKEKKARKAREHLSWDGTKNISGKRFVVYEEQGLGDKIQFCRYLPLLVQENAFVTFQVTSALHSLLGTLDSNIILTNGLPSEDQIDFEVPLMSLPYLFKTEPKTIPASIPYLYADEAKVKLWAERLHKDNFKIGICWQGSKTKVDVGRSFPLSLFEKISRISDVELISLHKGLGEDQVSDVNFNLTSFDGNFDTGTDAFIDTAAIMANCDLIITSDTAVAHLAGALGRPTWVALKYIPDWRWMLNRSDNQWYPTMTLYRQKITGDWASVFDAINQDLLLLIDQKRTMT